MRREVNDLFFAERFSDFFLCREVAGFFCAYRLCDSFVRRGCVIFSCAERLSDLHRDGIERLCDFFVGRV